MPFKFAPVPIPDDYVWKGRCFHLTYPRHVPFTAIHEAVARLTSVPLLAHSFVHEEVKKEGDTYTYAHTHAGLIMSAVIKVKGSRKMDIFMEDPDDDSDDDESLPVQLHPNIQPKVTLKSMEDIFTTYHRGRKYSIETGKYEYTPPIALEQNLPADFNFHQQIIKDIIDAPTLIDAVVVGEIRPRTVLDCQALRADAANNEAKKFIHKFAKESFIDIAHGIDWFSLHVWGATNLGKTKWALAQFDNPLHIKPFNSVGGFEAIKKRYDPKFHDGLVLDEVDLTFMSREMAIAFLDADDPFSCNIRYGEFELEPVKKILISNSHPIELYPKDESGAIFRRLKSLHINGKTWKQPEVTAAERTPLAPIIAQRVNHFSEGSQPTQLVNPPPHIAENSNAPVVPIPYPNY